MSSHLSIPEFPNLKYKDENFVEGVLFRVGEYYIFES